MTISEQSNHNQAGPRPSSSLDSLSDNMKDELATLPAQHYSPPSSSAMRIIPPSACLTGSSEENAYRSQALHYLNQLGTKILPKSHRYFQKFISADKDESVRRIQTNRFEIFLHNAGDKGSAAIDTLLKKHKLDPDAVKKCILDYATSQASTDERLKGQKLKFGNFSLIVNYGAVEAQSPHVDLLEPNYQFGMIVSEGPGTIWYDAKHKVQTPEDLAAAWQRTDVLDEQQQRATGTNLFGQSTPQYPEKMTRILESSPAVKTLLDGYGDVLVPDEELADSAVMNPRLPVGTVCSLPGSVVHAGPKTDGFRAVLFFSAWPVGNGAVAEYDPDTQYGSVFLCGRIAQLLWRHVDVDYEIRKYMLQKLYRYICQGGNKPRRLRVNRNWYSHFPFDAWSAVVKRLELVKFKRGEDLEFIDKSAQNEKLNFFNIKGSIDQTLRGDFVLVSLPNLYSDWEGSHYEVHIFVRPLDGKTLLFYPKDQSQNGGNSWEGTEEESRYNISRNDGQAITLDSEPWYDGNNGTLKDDDGDVIKCHVKEGATPTPILGHGESCKWHQAKENETVRSIAKKYSVDVDLLVQANKSIVKNLDKASRLKAGTKIIVAPLEHTNAPSVMVHRPVENLPFVDNDSARQSLGTTQVASAVSSVDSPVSPIVASNASITDTTHRPDTHHDPDPQDASSSAAMIVDDENGSSPPSKKARMDSDGEVAES